MLPRLLSRPVASCRLLSRAAAVRRPPTMPAATRGTYTYEWPRPGVTADAVCVAAPTPTAPAATLLLIQRGAPPGRGRYALPGGFVEVDEPPADAAARELEEETGVRAAALLDGPLTIVGAYGGPGRDPRGWCVTAAYAGVARDGRAAAAAVAGDDAAAVGWHPVTALPALAFDHQVIVRDAFGVLAERERRRTGGVDAALIRQLEAGAAALAGEWEPMTE